MKWEHPPIIKIYEALGALVDGRVESSGNTAKVFSSSGNKFYEVSYDPEKRAIMANDNGSYWNGYLGYPSIAFLLKIGALEFHQELANLLKGIPWKDLNTKFKNDFGKTLQHIENSLRPEDKEKLAVYARAIDSGIEKLNLDLLGTKAIPPEGY